ncbi:lysine histidine transporter-like 8 [Telopea speciosissima]|uniref:lysine histidine transporter-like 8 n=1 Tax=Telopea speciosissima TaxID=54955 RepID=UPI001CC665C0|nr:lysine histidine transporter-like 8 [Telopea speciosissima]
MGDVKCFLETERSNPECAIGVPSSEISSPNSGRSSQLPGLTSATPKTTRTTTTTTTPSRFIAPLPPPPLACPVPGKAAIVATRQGCLDLELDEEVAQVGHNHKRSNPTNHGGGGLDAWLPITESRNGNAFYSAFHSLNSGIGFQALLLPLAFTILGWTWGIVSLSFAFGWQLYTLWLLIQLHESDPETRYSRYLHLAKAAFGEKRGKLMALFPIMYLSGGTCVALITLGGGTMKLFFQTVCEGTTSCLANPLTNVEWFLLFTCTAVVLAQLPNLNSIAGVSLIGAITAMTYCTIIWVVSVTHGRAAGASYEPFQPKSDIAKTFSILNALGIIAFAFRGHNLVLEIQGTMPSIQKHPSQVPMWKGVKFAYLLIAVCLYPLAIAVYWAYGNQIPQNNGMLYALFKFHGKEISRVVLGLTSVLVVINCLSSFQIYAMPVFDNLEFAYTSKKNKPCSRWIRTGIRAFFGCLAFFIAVALPVLGSLAGLLGGIALPITLAYPCFMWIQIKRPQRYGAMWFINWGLGILGMVLSFLVIAGAVWSIVDRGIKPNFFRPS